MDQQILIYMRTEVLKRKIILKVFRHGLMEDGIYRRKEFAIKNIFDICAIINAELEPGIQAKRTRF